MSISGESEPQSIDDPTRNVDGYGPAEPQDCPETSFPLTVQAEDAAHSGLVVSEQLTGFRGTALVEGFDEIGDAITFEFCAPETDYYTFELRYANGSQDPAWRTIYIDDEILPGEHLFRARWTWNDWGRDGAGVRDSALLDAGLHRITVSFEPIDTGVVAIDEMSVTRASAPSSTSITSMLMNDWRELVVGVSASRLFPRDDTDTPPRIGELRWRGNWNANLVDQAAGYLRDETGGIAYTEFDRRPMETSIVMRDDGVLEQEYLSWGGSPLPANVTKEHATVPNEGMVVVRYTVSNATPEERELSMLEYVDLNRTGQQTGFEILFPGAEAEAPSGSMQVEWRDDLQAFIADVSELHGSFVVFGTFETADGVATGPAGGGEISPGDGSDADGSGGGSGAGASQEVASLVSQFADGDAITRNLEFAGDDAEMGMVRTFSLQPGASTTFGYFYAVRGSLAEAEAAAREAREQTLASWFDETANAWMRWLNQRQPVDIADPALLQAYETALVSVKQTQQPEFGSFVAATNPAYQYKVWPRDASVVAMGLDAAGYVDEADAYWRWMASVQETGEDPEFPSGTWWTNYSYWQADEGIPFVQPEWDSLGLFTIGVYRHYLLLAESGGDSGAASRFLAEVWPAVERAADFIANNIGDNNLGPQDFSIWEDNLSWATFTQVTYASGLVAAYELAHAAMAREDRSIDRERVERWRGAAQRIRGAILAPYDGEQCTGLWNPEGGHFLRGILPDCTADRRVDASTDLVWVFGLLGVEDEKARSHRETVLATLTPTDYFQGISRYEDDTFYYTSIFSPGGIYESSVPEPTWPQMSMYMAMAEHWLGLDELARARLDWYTSVTGVGFMPPGESIDWSTQQPLVSTAVEPVTGTWYLLALLVNTDQFDPRLDTSIFEETQP